MADIDVKRLGEVMKQIQEHGAKNSSKNYQAKKARLNDLNATVGQLQEHYKKACDKVAKEKADVDKLNEQKTTKDFFKDPKVFEEKMSIEQEEYLEAMSEQEVAKKNLEGVQQQKKQLEQEVASEAKQIEGLMNLYAEQDSILGKIFNGEYGSVLENKLESEFDHLLEKKERIMVAKYKWVNARKLIDFAVKQLGVACAKWTAVRQCIEERNVQNMYHIATDGRNNVIAASQNIASAQKYLNNIEFPYCKPDEMKTLQAACMNMYTDMQTKERHAHANEVFTVTYRRAAALLQWFDHVINDTINKDLEKARAELAPVEKDLREERLRLIKEKMGSDAECLELNQMEIEDDTVEQELMAIAEPDKSEGSQDTLSVEDTAPKAPTPLPLGKLAPPPSDQDLFGNIEQLKKQHEKEVAEFDKAQEINKARLEQGLQEKLAARRHRRANMSLE